MTIAEQARLIETAFASWAKTNKGNTLVTADSLDVLGQLGGKPGAPTIAILFFDEQVHGDYPELGRVLRTWKIVISRGRGLNVRTGESLTDGVAGGPPMFDLVEEAREIARAIRVSDMEREFQLPVYKGTGPFELSGYILDAFEIRFSLFANNPRQDGEPAAKPAQDSNPTE